MNIRFPEDYADCGLLPFNRAALDNDFILETPSHDPGGPGCWLLLQGIQLLVIAGDKESLPFGPLPAMLGDIKDALYIGRWRGQPCRLLAVSRKREIPTDLQAINILGQQPGLSLALLSLAGLGNAVLHWEKTSRCCDNCGAKMLRLRNEWGKKCVTCSAQHYPRIHPCIIVLVRRGRELLLVRKPEWPAERFGLVAGFVEFSENLEQTVERELFEETGIRVDNICYQGSQSWPFPSQLMAGFSADYRDGEIRLQTDELTEGGWFSIDNLPQLPPKRSIARWLIDKTVKDLQP
ncbi:MAG: NAD(+) diphosphatase [Geopsychrobacter sp.]|nr:NAD(+) diphosphatase [Geopsychrobacter sp.]